MKNFFLLCCLLFATLAAATIATPVTVSTVTCTGSGATQVCTVTTAIAHSVPLNDPGFCILSSSITADNICGTAATVPTSTTYTVNAANMAACASSCGTSQPAPVFMLKGTTPSLGQQNVSVCMYVFVTTGIATSGATTSCAAQFSGALQTEINSAIAAGTWVEYGQTHAFSNSATVSTIEQFFQALQFSYQLQTIAPGGVSGHECDVTGCD